MAVQGAPVILRKVVKKGEEGHHGGAWKVAYADFVTAMMAFFLLMWLLNATTEKQRKGLADYFDPSIPLARISAGGTGVLGGETVTVPQVRAGSRELPPATEGRQGRGDFPPSERTPLDTLPDRPNDAGQLEEEDGQAPGAETYAAARAAEERRLSEIAGEISAAVGEAGGAAGEHFLLRLTPEGLKIEIVDTGSEPLFASGSATASAELLALIDVIVPILGLVTNPIDVVGHTDASPFAGGASDNWSLSSARANAARRLLVAAGLPEARIARVSGRAARQPISPDPTAPENRRIAITLLRVLR